MTAMDPLEPNACYPALVARDARFDGRFFVGVTSTGVYCRPICRVRTPKLANCRFFGTAAQAEAARFRPCLKCRPELAPRSAFTAMDAAGQLAREAARLIEAGEDSMFAVAERLGVTDRHLRRIFAAEHGVTPLQYLQTRRLLLAKQLLTDSALPVAQVAHASGFASLRRFNAAFLAHYRLQPTALRREGGQASVPALRLAYREPYDVDGLLRFLEARAIRGVEQVDVPNAVVERSVVLVHQEQCLRGGVRVSFTRPGRVEVQLAPVLWPAVASLLPLLRRWLDLDADPAAIAAALPAGAPQGLRLPGALDRFELAVRAVLGQQVTVAAARTVAGRFVERFGTPLEGGLIGFPQPQAIAGAPIEHIAELGIIRQRAAALQAIAAAWPGLLFAQGALPSDEQLRRAQAELEALPGIGPWTARYMLMRGWSWPDAWLPGDVALKKARSGQIGTGDEFRPYRSYAVLHFWRTLT
ncbi:MAG: helix-turn-helix domain-containing protein [Paucibacter sp.]|nr:helix-turn-helix domain-containing protein [Roseateles sp.]